MPHPNELVIDRKDFLRLRGECDEVVDINIGLPNFVFRSSLNRFHAFEHAYIARATFSSFLHNIADTFGETVINYMTIKPDPVEYYYKNLSFFGMATFQTETLGDRYMPVMSRNGQADSFLIRGGDISVFWGQSLQWAIFCDRISWELAILGTAGEVDMSRMTAMRWLDAEALSRYIRSQYQSDIAAADGFVEAFLRNYLI